MSSKQKILHLNNYIPVTSGVSRYIRNIIKSTSSDFEHEVICFGGDAMDFIKAEGIATTKLKWFGKLSAPGIYQCIKKYIVKNNIDIVHSHHRIFDTLSSLIKSDKLKSITTVHSKVMSKQRLSYKSRKLVVVSNAIKDHLQSYYNIPGERIVLLRNFIIPDDYLTREQGNLTNGEKIILFPSRFEKEKGIDILINAFEEITKKYNNIKLVLVGEGREEKRIKKLSDRLNLRIEIQMPQENISSFYSKANMVVLPSRVDSFPYVMLEAGLFSKPFVGSNVDGIPELIEDGQNGLLFESGNVNQLTSKLEWVLENPIDARELGRNLNKKVVENYSVDKLKQDYVNLYKNL